MSFSFNAPASQPAANSTFAFGAPKTTAATGSSFSFGSPATTAATAFSFGSPAGASAPSAAPTLGFGTLGGTAQPATASVAPTFSFGATTASTTAPTTAQTGVAAPPFNFNNQTTSAATATSGFGLGGSTSAAQPTLTLGGQPSTTAPGFGLSGGLFGKTTTTANSSGLNFGTTPTTTTLSLGASGALFDKTSTATPFVGLGGIDISASQPKAGTSIQDIKEKETLVPDEIVKTVETLKNYIKTQKQLSSDIGRSSVTKLSKVSGEISRLKLAVQKIENAVSQNYLAAQALKRETSRVNMAVDMAVHTRDTPPGLQIENNAPFKYFEELVTKYEHDLNNIKQLIATTESHMRSISHPSNISPEDFTRCLHQINESFISLAGRIHELHQKVETQKEEYLKLRRRFTNDTRDIFENLHKNQAKPDTSQLVGRTPFTNMSAMSSLSYLYANMSNTGANVSNTQAPK